MKSYLETDNMIKIRRFFTILLILLFSLSGMGQTRRALVVGISDYPQTGENAWAVIHGVNDADLVTSVLKKQSFKVTKVCDKAATADRIRSELNKLVMECKKGDIVYLHFSCHGQPFEDIDGDEEDGWDESIIPYDAKMVYQKGKYEGTNHITDDELNTYFQKLRKAVGEKGMICVVIDACHSGGSSRGEEDEETQMFVRGTKNAFSPSGKDFRPRINAKGNFQIPKDTDSGNIVILEACRSYQSNYEIKESGKYYGSLSYYVSQVLEQKALSLNLDWVMEVKKMMDADTRLIRQNMVYETSLK